MGRSGGWQRSGWAVARRSFWKEEAKEHGKGKGGEKKPGPGQDEDTWHGMEPAGSSVTDAWTSSCEGQQGWLERAEKVQRRTE